MQKCTRIPKAPKASVNSAASSQYLLSYGFAKSHNHGHLLSGKKKQVTEGDEILHNKVSSLTDQETPLSDNQSKNGLLNGVEEKTASGIQEENGQSLSSNLTTTQFDMLSYNLSELADRISPVKIDHDFELPGTAQQNEVGDGNFNSGRDGLSCRTNKPVHMEDRSRSFSESSVKERDSSLMRSKLPYSRKPSHKMKNYVPKQKHFVQKQVALLEKETVNGSQSSCRETKSESSQKHDSEDSGYGSSQPTLQGTNYGKELVIGHEHRVPDDSEGLTRKISDVEKRLKSLITSGKSFNLGDQKAEEKNFDDSASISEKSGKSGVHHTSTAEATSSNSSADVFSAGDFSETAKVRQSPAGAEANTAEEEISKTFDPTLERSPFHPPRGKAGMVSRDDSAIPRQKARPTLVRRRTTLVSFRRPRLMATQDIDGDVVELDETTYTQCIGDIKNVKTMLLKLKRELQEAEVMSPLSHSFTKSASSVSANTSNAPRDMIRTGTYDAATMHEKLLRIRSASMSSSAPPARKQETNSGNPAAESSKEDEVSTLRAELRSTKKKVDEMSQERRMLLIGKEELEHEIDSKNLTIKLLQKQLEAQDNQEEVAYLKRQVKLLSEQVHQNKSIVCSSTPSTATPSTTPVKKDSAKTDIRNRLRDAFVRHLDQSAKNHAQLSKHIQKAEHNISEAQKGLRSLYSSPVSSHSTSMEDLDDCALNSQSLRGRRVQMDFFDPKSWLDRARRALPQGRRRKSSVEDSAPNEHARSVEQPIRSKGLKEVARRCSVPVLGSRSSEPEVESGSHTDGESLTPRKHCSRDLIPSEKSVRKQSRLRPAWAPGTIEKIVKSWKETRAETSQKPLEAEVLPSDSKLGPRRGQPHVDFL